MYGRGELVADPWVDTVTRAWNLMGSTVDWSALPIVVELLDVPDPARLIAGLTQLRDTLKAS